MAHYQQLMDQVLILGSLKNVSSEDIPAPWKRSRRRRLQRNMRHQLGWSSEGMSLPEAPFELFGPRRPFLLASALFWYCSIFDNWRAVPEDLIYELGSFLWEGTLDETCAYMPGW